MLGRREGADPKVLGWVIPSICHRAGSRALTFAPSYGDLGAEPLSSGIGHCLVPSVLECPFGLLAETQHWGHLWMFHWGHVAGCKSKMGWEQYFCNYWISSAQ